MKQRIVHGATIDALTADELFKLLPRPEERSRVRVPGSIQLDAAGAVLRGADVYKVPTGYELEVRRVVLTLAGNGPQDPNSGSVLLNAAGKWVNYLRSGSIIEPAQPAYGAAIQVPGVQTWGSEQGPYLRNGEVFGVAANGLTANALLNVYLEGILRRPSTDNGDHA